MSFHEVVFPEDISYGSSGGPAFKTSIIELSSGHEQRNIDWSETKATYDVSHGIKTREQMEELIDFFYARRGRAYGFRFKDWADFECVNEKVGVGDGAISAFQMIKNYEPEGYTYVRKIRKINPGTMKVYKNGGLTAFTVDNNTGMIQLSSVPAVGDVITASCEFHVPVRFDIDEMKIAHDAWETMSWPSISLVEIKPRLANGSIVV